MRKPYVREMRANWWLKNRAYFLFMLREFTALFIGAYAVLLLVLLWKLHQGPQPYAAFIQTLKSPFSVSFHIVALVMALYNTVTTFKAMPQVMPLRRGENTVAPEWLALANGSFMLVVTMVLIGVLINR